MSEHDCLPNILTHCTECAEQGVEGLHAELEGYRIANKQLQLDCESLYTELESHRNANKRIRTELGELAASYEGIVAERDHYRAANVKLQERCSRLDSKAISNDVALKAEIADLEEQLAEAQ